MKDSNLHKHKSFIVNQLKLQILVCQGMRQSHTVLRGDKAMHEMFRQSSSAVMFLMLLPALQQVEAGHWNWCSSPLPYLGVGICAI